MKSALGQLGHLVVLLAAVARGLTATAPRLQPAELRVLGAEGGFLGHRRPDFRWQLRCPGCRSVRQLAYRLQVREVASGQQLHDSGQVHSPKLRYVAASDIWELQSASDYEWQVQVWVSAEGAEELSGTAFGALHTALLDPSDWGDAGWIGGGSAFRGTFHLPANRTLVSAVASVSSGGCYELSINGQRVHPDTFLEPSWATMYQVRVHYRAYTVLPLLLQGANNAVGLRTGMCKFTSDLGRCPGAAAGYTAECRAVIFHLALRYADGSTDTVVSRPGQSWLATTAADPIRYSDLYHGEIYDARLEDPSWDQPKGFSPRDDRWQAAKAYEGAEQQFGALVLAELPPITVSETRTPISISKLAFPRKSAAYVFDFGQNLAGFATLRLSNVRSGTVLTLQYAEVLRPDGSADMAFCSSPSDCRANQTDVYTARGGGEEVFTPHFTYHGFRRVQINGLPDSYDVSFATLTAHFVHTNVGRSGSVSFPTQDLLNRIQTSVVYTQLGNMHHHPEDCPQREKSGWMGDAQITSVEASMNFDTTTFYKNWAEVMSDLQQIGCRMPARHSGGAPAPYVCCDPEHPGFGCDYHGVTDNFTHARGSLPDVVPYPQSLGGWPGDPSWGAAGVAVPRALMAQRGEAVTEEMYQLARGVVEFFNAHGDPAVGGVLSFGYYGDWLTLDGTPNPQVTGFSHLLCLHYMVDLAKSSGKDADAVRYSKMLARLKMGYHKRYWQPSTSSYGTSQTANVLPLYLDIPPPEVRDAAIAALVSSLQRSSNKISTGIIGTAYILPTLLKLGRGDLAFQLATNTEQPSWGHFLSAGPGTIWEAWDGGTNSHNHPALAASIGTYLYYMAGIRPHEGWQPGGGRKVVFELDLVSAALIGAASVSTTGQGGTASFEWVLRDGTFALNASIPHGEEAEIRLPDPVGGGLQAPDPCELRAPNTAWAPCQLGAGPPGTAPQARLQVASGVHELRARFDVALLVGTRQGMGGTTPGGAVVPGAVAAEWVEEYV